ncbi:MAG: hypothetical protein NTV94_05650 [Planctomycetota bacterium]|nr:hypothetical protein [Planctomycetota bacterium]
MKTVSISIVALAGIAASASAIDLTHLKTIDVSAFSASSTAANYIGSNPSAIAWDGTDLYVGGYNSAGAVAPTAINKVSSALSSDSLGATSFGSFGTANSRGIAGLAIKNGQLAAGLDNGGGNANSVRAFSVTGTPTQQWSIGAPTSGTGDSTRRGMALDFDPGFNAGGTNQGIAYLSTGSGRRHLLNSASGLYINGQNAGAIINFNPASTTWRDMAFNPSTGDLYTRESNRVGKAVRNGDNSFTTVSGGQSVAIVTGTVAAGVDNQNLAFINSPTQGNFLMYNDRSVVTPGQAFSNVVKAVDLNGAALTLNFLNAFSALDGNGAYDFSFNAASNTLAVSDFANRKVYLFGVPTPGSLGALGLAGLVATRRRRA